MQARWPVANGGINDEFIQLFFRLQRVKPGFNLFGSTGDQRRFTAGNARRSAAGLAGKSDGLRLTADGHPLAVLQLDAPHLDLLRQRGGGGRIVSNHHLDGDHRLTRTELAPAVEHGTAQRAVAIEMGGKDKVPVKAGGQFSTLQAGAEQKTVCPARRDRRGA